MRVDEDRVAVVAGGEEERRARSTRRRSNDLQGLHKRSDRGVSLRLDLALGGDAPVERRLQRRTRRLQVRALRCGGTTANQKRSAPVSTTVLEAWSGGTPGTRTSASAHWIGMLGDFVIDALLGEVPHDGFDAESARR
jgi:hypothetical protein